jgi:hypothetical protein
MRVGGQLNAPAALPRERDPVPIVSEVGWDPGTVWTGEENIAPTGIRSPDRPARIESLYRLSYPGPQTISRIGFNFIMLRKLLKMNRWNYSIRICVKFKEISLYKI